MEVRSMSINIEQVMEYLDTHPVGRHEGDFRSLLEIIHGIFAECYPVDSGQLREKYGRLDRILKQLPYDGEDAVNTLVCDLCYEHEQLGFEYGIVVGMQLMSEINALQ